LSAFLSWLTVTVLLGPPVYFYIAVVIVVFFVTVIVLALIVRNTLITLASMLTWCCVGDAEFRTRAARKPK
jgi:hypothetical protein